MSKFGFFILSLTVFTAGLGFSKANKPKIDTGKSNKKLEKIKKDLRVETLAIKNKFSFSKKEITVSLGESIEFFNDKKGKPHILYTQKPQNVIRVKKGDPGQKLKIGDDFKKYKGKSFEVKCANHPGMNLKVNVRN